LGLGDHCRDTSGSRAYNHTGDREEQMDNKTTNGVDVRSDIKKEIVKIKKALSESEDHSVVNVGDFNIKRPAMDDLEESKPKKKKKKRRSKAAAAAPAEKNESIEPMPKPIENENDNYLLRKKLQEILDENMKLKVDFQSLKRKWDDADSRIAKLEELARDKDAKIVELEHENVIRTEKLESKNRIISDLEKDNRLAKEKLDTKRKLIRDLDDKILEKDDKFESIKNEIDEKERHLTKLIQVKDELYKSKEVVTKENEKIKKLAKDISNDSDVLMKKLLEKEEIITDLNRPLKKPNEKQNFGVEGSTSESDNEKLKKVLIDKEREIQNLQGERDEAVQSHVELEITVKDLKRQIKKEMLTKKEIPETTLSEKCDSSVAYDDDGENSDLEIDTALAIGDSLFEPLSDKSYNSDDDLEVLKVTSTENPNGEKNYKFCDKKVVFCPFKLEPITEYFSDNSNKKTSCRILKRKLANVEVPCLSAISGSSRNLMLTLDEFTRTFYPKLSVERVGIILEEFDIPLYMGNIDQQEVLRNDKMDHTFNPVPLIMFEDVENNKDDLDSLISSF